MYWFFPDSRDDEIKGYRLGSIEPTTPTPYTRITIGSNRDLVTEDKSPLPETIEREFISFWKASMSAVYTETEMSEFEDRGEWQDI